MKIFQLCLIVSTINCFGQGTSQSNLFANSEYASATVFFSTINVTITTINTIKINRPYENKSNSAWGFIFGSLQTITGITNIHSKESGANMNTAINIGLGLTTILLSAVRLGHKDINTSSLSVDLFYPPPKNFNERALGITLIKRIDSLPSKSNLPQ